MPKHVTFWDKVILEGHPLRDELISYVRDGVGVYDFLVDSSRGPSRALPYNVERFPGTVFANRIPSSHASFMDAEMNSLVERECVVMWSDVRGSSGPVRPRLIQTLSAEETKPRLMYDARPLNQRCKRIRFTMDTVARAANVASESCFQGSLDDSSSYHHILLKPASWRGDLDWNTAE